MSVNCNASYEKQFRDIKIVGIEEYSKSNPKKPLNGSLMPIITKKQYDIYATEILTEFYVDALKEPIKVDAKKLASNMGFKVKLAVFPENEDIFGRFYFRDSKDVLYSIKDEKFKPFTLRENTILYNKNKTLLGSYGCKNMTIVHECIHGYLHKKPFAFLKLYNRNLKYVSCNINIKNEANKDLHWMEIQANGIAPCILMPKEPFIKYVKSKYSESSDLFLNIIEDLIESISHKFGVSRYAARKRLIDLGYEEAIGAFNWADEKYVRPYAFKKGSLETNETYTFNINDFIDLIYKPNNVLLLGEVINGNYLIVENHLVINDPKYIEKDLNFNYHLTEYARYHVDECCVKFKFKSKCGNYYSSEYGLLCYLNRDTSKEIEFDLEVSKAVNIKNIPQFTNRLAKHHESINTIMANISYKPFNEALKYILEFLDITRGELEIDADVSERTLDRYLTPKSEKNKQSNKVTIVKLVRALNLPAEIVTKLLERAGVIFVGGDKIDDILHFILYNMRHFTHKEVDNYLKLNKIQ